MTFSFPHRISCLASCFFNSLLVCDVPQSCSCLQLDLNFKNLRLSIFIAFIHGHKPLPVVHWKMSLEQVLYTSADVE